MDSYAMIFDPAIETGVLEKQILNFLEEYPTGTDISCVVQNFERSFEPDYIKQVVWQLISKGDIRLTPQRKLIIPG